jgi:hypothetical protein
MDSQLVLAWEQRASEAATPILGKSLGNNGVKYLAITCFVAAGWYQFVQASTLTRIVEEKLAKHSSSVRRFLPLNHSHARLLFLFRLSGVLCFIMAGVFLWLLVLEQK